MSVKKVRPNMKRETAMSINQQVLTEIQIFLKALDSYPDCFARDPQITFEQHHCGLISPSKTESDRLN
jgi:hypothetical protein